MFMVGKGVECLETSIEIPKIRMILMFILFPISKGDADSDPCPSLLLSDPWKTTFEI